MTCTFTSKVPADSQRKEQKLRRCLEFLLHHSAPHHGQTSERPGVYSRRNALLGHSRGSRCYVSKEILQLYGEDIRRTGTGNVLPSVPQSSDDHLPCGRAWGYTCGGQVRVTPTCLSLRDTHARVLLG
jgi:hypothetical protein